MIEVGQIWHSKGFSYLDNQYDTKYCSSVYLRIKEKSQTRENAWVLELSRSFGGDFGPSGTFDHTEEDLRSNYVCMDSAEDYYKPIPTSAKLTSSDVFPPDDRGPIRLAVFAVSLIIAFVVAAGLFVGSKLDKRDRDMESRGYVTVKSGEYYQKGDKMIAFVRGIPVLTDPSIVEMIGCNLNERKK